MQALENYLAAQAHDAEFMAWKLASESTGAYINRHLFSVRLFKSDSATPRNDFDGRNALLDHAVRHVTSSGLFVQCGLRNIDALNFLARVLPPEQIIHGVGSLETVLEERPLGNTRRGVCRSDEPPKVRSNVRLHTGWIEESFPAFLDQNREPIAFLYLDLEDYAANQLVLNRIGNRFSPGAIIVFEEYFNFPGWEQFGYRAFQEWIAGSPFQYEYIGFTPRHYSVAVKLFART